MLTYEHGSWKGVGSQLVVDIRRANPILQGCAMLEIRRQTNDGDTAGSGAKRWEFNDPNPAVAELSVPQIAHLLAVLRGQSPNILGGKGIVAKEDDRVSLVHLDMTVSEKSQKPEWYDLHIKTTWANGEKAEGRIRLNPTEAASLEASLASAMGAIAFG